MTTQDDIFKFYSDMANGSSYKSTGRFDVAELSKTFPEHDVIEMVIAMEGGSRLNWEYGYWRKYQSALIDVYGMKLVPYLEERIREPFHAGGTAYGDDHLMASKRCVVDFCMSTLYILNAIEAAL